MGKIILTVAPFTNIFYKNNICLYEMDIDVSYSLVKRFYEMGASIVYLPILFDNLYSNNYILSYYEKLVYKIRSNTNMLVHLTLMTNNKMSTEDQNKIFDLKPDIVSILPGSINIANNVLVNTTDQIEYLAYIAMSNGIKTCIEVFDTTMVYYSQQMKKKRLLLSNIYYNLVVGTNGISSEEFKGISHDFLNLLDSIPCDSSWSVSCLGKYQKYMEVFGILCGGHLRTNRIKYAAKIANSFGREVATPDETKVILNCG